MNYKLWREIEASGYWSPEELAYLKRAAHYFGHAAKAQSVPIASMVQCHSDGLTFGHGHPNFVPLKHPRTGSKRRPRHSLSLPDADAGNTARDTAKRTTQGPAKSSTRDATKYPTRDPTKCTTRDPDMHTPRTGTADSVDKRGS